MFKVRSDVTAVDLFAGLNWKWKGLKSETTSHRRRSDDVILHHEKIGWNLLSDWQ